FDNGLRGVQQLRGFIALAEAGTIAAGKGIAPHLNKLGIAGVALSAMFAASEASGASPEEARSIMEEWAVDAIGSEVGSIVAASLATAAAAAFTTLTAPVTIPLVIGASIAGGFFGSDLAASFHAFLNDKDEAAERDMLRRLSKLYFGDGTTVTAETIPAQGANFAFIDPALAPEAMAQAANASISWRYALVELNPFLVPEGPYESIHNINGELDRYEAATGTGLTDEYLEARAEALHTYVRLLEQDERISAGNVFPGGYDIHFLDAQEHGGSFEDGVVLDLHYTSDYKEQRLFGGSGDDVLTGSTAHDMLFGGNGDDLLRGMGDADYLEGGEGHDTYFAGDGDRIFDHDGIGRVLFDEDPLVGGARDDDSGAYASGDGKYLYTLIGTDLAVQRTGDGAILTISNFDNGNLGIKLEGSEPPPPSNRFQLDGTADSEVIYGRTDPGVTDYEQVNGYNLPDHIQGQEGRDWIYAWDNGMQAIVDGTVVNSAPDSDIVEGGSGKDFIHGGAGDDKLYATVLADAAAVKAGQGSLAYGGPSNDEGDFVSGQGGNDELYGSGRVDGLFGGDGDDLIYGGGGDDVIAGDWSAVVSPLSLNTATYDYAWYSFDAEGNRQFSLFGYSGGIGSDRVYAGDGNDLVWGGAADDIIYGEVGNDRLNGDYSGIDVDGNPALPSRHHGNDFLSGGPGDDGINGNGGSDILLGGDGNDYLDGDFRVVIGDDATYHGDDYLDGGKGSDILTGNGGNDVLLGGDDDDALFGDLVGLDASHHGADVLYGGAGNDRLEGQGGDDTLYGGTGDDILVGDATELDIAYHGEDTIHGGDGHDSLAGLGGNDLLYGGKGSDGYEFSTGDGLDIIVDTEGGLNGDSLNFFGIGGIGAVTLTLEAGDLHAKIDDEGFVFRNWNPSQFGGIYY
ncbi:MAG: calcium-binding protein, partial [Sedimenticolaceae bacterium]